MIESTRFPELASETGLKPGVLPFWLGLALAVLSLLLIAQSIKTQQKETTWISSGEIVGVGTVFLALALYAGLMEYLGFGTATILLVAFISRRLGKYHWWKCLLLGLVAAVVSVKVFRDLLTLSLPTGLTGF